MIRSKKGERNMRISKLIPKALFSALVALALTFSSNLEASENTSIMFVSSIPEYVSPDTYDSDFEFGELSTTSFDQVLTESVNDPSNWTLAKNPIQETNK